MASGSRVDPALWLGDAARAVEHLRANAEIAADIVQLLQIVEHSTSSSTLVVGTPARFTRVPARPSPPGRFINVTPSVPLEVVSLLEHVEGPPTEVHEEAATGAQMPRPLPNLSEVLPSAAATMILTPATLLAPIRSRAILGALASSIEPLGEPDVDQLVGLLASRRPIRSIPRRETLTTRRGVRLLVDFGEGMRGFTGDRDAVWRAMERIAGEDGLEVLRFAGTPHDPPGVGPGPKRTWKPYTAGAPGRPVVVITDLGTRAPVLERPSLVRRWAEFASSVKRSGSTLVALVPVPIRRVAPELLPLVGVVEWDRGTGVRQVISAARRIGRS